MSWLARHLTAPRWSGAIAALALLGAGAVIGIVGTASHTAAPTDSLPIGSDSAAAAELQQKLPAADATTAIVLFTSDAGTLSAGRPPRHLVPAEDGPGSGARAPDREQGRDRRARGRPGAVQRRRGRRRRRDRDPRHPVDRAPPGVTAQVTGPAASRPTWPRSSTEPTCGCCSPRPRSWPSC